MKLSLLLVSFIMHLGKNSHYEIIHRETLECPVLKNHIISTSCGKDRIPVLVLKAEVTKRPDVMGLFPSLFSGGECPPFNFSEKVG